MVAMVLSKIQVNQLYIIVCCLSLLVLFQSLYIVSVLRLVAFEQIKQIEQLPQEIDHQAKAEAKQLVETDGNTNPQVFLWLEQNKLNKTITIWASSLIPVSELTTMIKYDPSLVAIIDSMPQENGIQVKFGQAPVYLQNEVNQQQGKITLVAQFAEPLTGTIELGSFTIKPLASGSIEFTVLAIPHSQVASFATTKDKQTIIPIKTATLRL